MRARLLLPLFAGLFLMLAAPTAAEAGCAQEWDMTSADSEMVVSFYSLEFDPFGLGGWYDCSFYEEYAGLYTSACYAARVTFTSQEYGVMSDSYMSQTPWGAYAGDQVLLAGAGVITVRRSGIEYLNDIEHVYVQEYGPHYSNFGSPVQQPTLTLNASNAQPVVNSGPVTVTAQYSAGAIEASSLSWSTNCTAVGNTASCSFDPTQVGQQTVSATYAGLQAQITINVQAAGQGSSLRLLLVDKNEQLNVANPFASDRAAQFIPGARFSDGTSLPLLDQAQEVELIAAFVGQNGQIVAPPQNVSSVTFTLSQTTIWVGKAMNDNSGDLLEDYGLGTEPLNRRQSLQVQFSNSQARASLSVYDYGGSTKVRASANTGGYESDLMGLPANVPNDSDGDESPSNPNHGDSFSNFEEWRGFIIYGTHIRTDPSVKDLFIYHTNPLFQLSYGAGFADDLGIELHIVSPADVDGASWLNFNSANGTGGETPGHRGQKALRIAEAGTPLCDSQGKQCVFGLWTPQTPNLGWFVNNTQLIEIWPRTVRKYSPTSPSETSPDAVDDDKIRQTIAHEIGHAITVSGNIALDGHVNISWLSCPLGGSQRTVMVSAYHVDTFDDPQTQKVCAWNDIPVRYRDIERQNFRLR